MKDLKKEDLHKEVVEKEDQMTKTERRLFELRMKMNAGRKANKKEVEEEFKRTNNPAGEKQQRNLEWKKKQEKIQEELKLKGIPAEKAYLTETAEVAQLKVEKQKKKEKNKASFGWEVFNQDSLYKSYKKRLDHLPKNTSGTVDESTLSSFDYGRNDQVTKEGVDRMVNEIEERIENRKKFSRRREEHEDDDITYIDRRNKMFNRRIEKEMGKYTIEIRQNLERGTAL